MESGSFLPWEHLSARKACRVRSLAGGSLSVRFLFSEAVTEVTWNAVDMTMWAYHLERMTMQAMNASTSNPLDGLIPS